MYFATIPNVIATIFNFGGFFPGDRRNQVIRCKLLYSVENPQIISILKTKIKYLIPNFIGFLDTYRVATLHLPSDPKYPEWKLTIQKDDPELPKLIAEIKQSCQIDILTV